MIKNYLKVALRNLKKRASFAVINILGLAIGIACCFLIAIFVLNELSYDEFHKKGDRIYRVTQKTVTSSKTEVGASTPFPVGPTLKSDYPEQIEKMVRFFDMQEEVRTILNRETDESFRVDDFYVADSTFFDVFTAELAIGDPEEVLDEPMSAVITEEQAERIFGDTNPVGKQLSFKGSETFTVTGVLKNMPKNSHFHVDMLLSFNSFKQLYNKDGFTKRWYWNPCWTYILLEEGAPVEDLEKQLPDFVEKNYANREEGEKISLGLQPLTDIHLYSDLDLEMESNGSIFHVYLFSAVAFLLLLIACINFTNLSTARSTERSREVGMRKVLGASRSQLFYQFMGESFLMTMLGFLLALGLAYWSLPWFSDFVGKELSIGFLGTGSVVVSLAGLFILVVLFSGMYPALYLSGYTPVDIMQGEEIKNGGGKLFRKGLVIFQFTLSVMLIIGTVIVYLQLQHMQDKKLGFDEDQVVVMPITQTLIAWYYPKFKEKALKNPAVKNVTGMSKVLGSDRQTFSKYTPANVPGAPPTNMILHVTHDFFDTYNINVLAGRPFSKDHPTDPDQAIVINKAMLQQLQVDHAEEALGKIFYYTNSKDERESYKVIGVVDNFYYTSIKKEISPLVINVVEKEIPRVSRIEYSSVRLAANNVKEGLEHIREVWNEVNHIDPFTYTFHNEELEKIYSSEKKMSSVAGIFSILCIFVACLGLFGLASFTTSLRTKEIGIRKALGATVPNILSLLSKDYVKLVIISNLIAWPVCYYLATQWLQSFPSRITLGWNIVPVFLAVGVGSILICILTVSYQSLRAALINPVDSIRQE
ncbi:ABC transporter permease [Fodinibius halophilus]|uniref:FtsX-like permease family protein n=1 Tax=Fodinibius halophilus TaxID=1736908 RepID=A0A6M1TAF6_9BACT|nr:ABC transporter permease [Fodinibius halophilus]NGP87332.1 FtsX-like permease family protein [Fodinibius halophilus]